MKVKTILLTSLFLLGFAGVIVAQQAQTTTREDAAAAETVQVDEDEAPDLEALLDPALDPDSYTYDPQGRRDPFRSLIGRSRGLRGGGVGSFLVEEIDVQGIVRTRDGYIAMITGPDNNGYSLRVGDKVFDGEIVRITPNAVVFRQETREVVRELAPRGARQN